MFASFPIQALTFDVFGTVVDVWGSLSCELKQFGLEKGIDRDWENFAFDWIVNGYIKGVDDVNGQDKSKFKNVDTLIRAWLNDQQLDLEESDKDRMCYAWHCLKPWDDVLSGMQRLRTRYKLVTLANANVSLLADIAYHAGLPWYKILSAETVKVYKTDQQVYRMAVDKLGLKPEEIMMVAAHKGDLMAAGPDGAGFQTAFVPRPLELGPRGGSDAPAAGDKFNVTAKDFNDLAEQLGV
jgi:2-haloacid dehalogenase